MVNSWQKSSHAFSMGEFISYPLDNLTHTDCKALDNLPSENNHFFVRIDQYFCIKLDQGERLYFEDVSIADRSIFKNQLNRDNIITLTQENIPKECTEEHLSRSNIGSNTVNKCIVNHQSLINFKTVNAGVLNLKIIDAVNQETDLKIIVYDSVEKLLDQADNIDCAEAINYYDYILSIKPDWIDTYRKRGSCFNELKQTEKAIKDFETTIKLNPNYGPGYFKLAMTYLDLNDYPTAIEYYTKAIKSGDIPPESLMWSYFARGLIYFLLGDYQAALDDNNKALEVIDANAPAASGPPASSVYLNRGLVQSNLGNYEAAMADFEKILQLTLPNSWSDYSLVYNNMALTLYEQGKFQEAREKLEIAIEINQKELEPEEELEAQFALAVILYLNGEEEEAIKKAKTVLDSDHRYRDFSFLRKLGWQKNLLKGVEKLLLEVQSIEK